MRTHPIFLAVLAAMQEAEELGGPEGEDYCALMDEIAAEAVKRASVARESNENFRGEKS